MATTSLAPVLGIGQRPKPMQWFILSLQHLCAMFGATVLVPALTGLSPAIALVSSGIGTLVFLVITQGKVPSYLGSSFAFINPIIAVKAFDNSFSGIMLGSIGVGLIYALVAFMINRNGAKWLMRMLPTIVVGPVIMVIGLGLASTAINMVSQHNGSYSLLYFSLGIFTLAITIIFAVFFRGFLSIIPILLGIIVGYLLALALGLVNTASIAQANWWTVPNFHLPFINYSPHWSWKALFLMMPVAIVPIAEHIGHQLVLSKIVDKDLVADPGLDRSLFGDGVATIVAGLIGAPPNTTYGENIGVLAITRAFSVYLFVGAAVLAILFGFCGKVAAVLSSIPTPVMGGVAILLFGIIASSGLRMMIENKVNFDHKRNLIIAAVILVIGIGGASLHIGDSFALEGMALASIVGVLLNLILPIKD